MFDIYSITMFFKHNFLRDISKRFEKLNNQTVKDMFDRGVSY